MKTIFARSTSLLLFLAFATLGSQPTNASAEEPYFLRFRAALRRPATGYSAAAALQATAAYPAGFSINPAADDLPNHASTDPEIKGTLTNLHAVSESSAWLTDTSVTAAISIPGRGTVPIAYARTDTIDSDTEQGFNNLLRSNEFFWGYSKCLTDSCAVGIQSRYATGEIRFEEVGSEIPIPLRFETDVEYEIDLNVGVHCKLSSEWALGCHAIASSAKTRTDVLNLVAFPNPSPPPSFIPTKTVLSTVESGFNTELYRVGIGYTPTQTIGMYVDGEYFQIDSEDGRALQIGRALLGLEYRFCRHRSLFFGSSIDKDGETTLSAGFRRVIADHLTLESSFQHNAFPEVEQEFGRFDQITFSVVVQ